MESGVLLGQVSLAGFLGLMLVLRVRPVLSPLSPWLPLCLLCGAAWTAGEVVAAQATSLEAKRLGLVILYSGSIFLPAVWLVTILRWSRLHAQTECKLRPVLQDLPIAVAIGFWLAMVSDPLHGGFVVPVVGGRNEYQPIFLALLAIGYGEILLAAVITARLAGSHPSAEVRRSSGLLALSSCVPLVANVVYLLSDDRTPAQWTGIVLSLSAGLALAAVWSGQRLWLLPDALRRTAVDDPDAVVLLDRMGRPVYWNPAVRRLLPDFEFAPEASTVDRLASRFFDPEIDASPESGAAFREDLSEAGIEGRLYRDRARGTWVRVCELPFRDGHGPTPATLRIEELGTRDLRPEFA